VSRSRRVSLERLNPFALFFTLSSLLFGVEAGDPWVLLEVGAFLIALVLLASWLASRRATRVDPLIALRYE